jgi:hypothetical protein
MWPQEGGAHPPTVGLALTKLLNDPGKPAYRKGHNFVIQRKCIFVFSHDELKQSLRWSCLA